MKIDALKTFVLIAEHRNFRVVAEAMSISQPAITKRVKALEDHFNVKLFNREGNEMILSSEGRSLLPYAERIVRVYDEMRSKTVDTQLWKGTIRLGVVDSILATWLTDFLELHQREFPNVEFEVSSAPTVYLLDELKCGRIDIGLMLGPSYDRPFIDVPLAPMEIGFYKGKSLQVPGYAKGRVLRPDALENLKIITFPRGSRPHLELEALIDKQKLQDRPAIINCVSILTMRSMAERGLGVASLPVPLALDDYLERMDLGFEMPILNFSATYNPTNANAVIRNACDIAAISAKRYLKNFGVQEQKIGSPE